MTTNRLVKFGMIIILAVVGLLLLYEFVYKGQVKVEGIEGELTLTIANEKGQTVTNTTQRSTRLLPGIYNVTVESDQHDIIQQVQVWPLTSMTIRPGDATKQEAINVANVGLFGIVHTGKEVIGLDPADESLKRIDRTGSITDRLFSNTPADNPGRWEPELPGSVMTYQPYMSGKAIVSKNGLLYVLGNEGIQEISIEGIAIDSENAETPKLLVATNPTSEAFIVAYGKDIYRYQNTKSKPEKIYTAQKHFNSIIFGGDIVGLYSTDIPFSRESLQSGFRDYQSDLLLVNTTNKAEQTVKGPMVTANISPAGSHAIVQPRLQTPYLYDIAKKQGVGTVLQSMTSDPYWLDTDNYLFAYGHSLWRYNVPQKASAQITELSQQITSITKDAAGNFWLTTFNGENQTGVYRVGSAGIAPESPQMQKLRTILPYATDAFGITFSDTGIPTITISTDAPLNDANQLDRYRQETIRLREHAMDYLRNAGADLNGITIQYEPGDPL